MNLTQLKYFLAVMESGNFSDAADSLYITQSAVSKQIMSLEEELGVTLFDRSHRKIRPTQIAELIHPHAQAILADHALLLRTVWAHTNRLRIAATPIIEQYDITSLLVQFQQLHPEVDLTITEREACNISKYLNSETCELAIFRLLPGMEDLYDILPLAQDSLLAILPKTHPLAKEETIDLAQLAHERFLLLDEGTLWFDQCISICQASGFTPQVTYTGNRPEIILKFVAQELGVSLMARKVVLYNNNLDIVAIPLKVPVNSFIVLAARKGHTLSPAATHFWSFLKATPSPLN